MKDTQSFLRQLLYNKSVAIVGGHDSIDWQRVNECDLVCRINYHWQRQGGRFDIHYTGACDQKPSFPHHLNGYVAYSLECRYSEDYANYTRAEKLQTAPFLRDSYCKPNPHGPEFEWLNSFSNELNTKPFTGFVAIRQITNNPVNRVFVTGMTLYDGEAQTVKTTTGLELLRRGPHMIQPHVEYLKFLHRSDPRVKFDSELEEIAAG